MRLVSVSVLIVLLAAAVTISGCCGVNLSDFSAGGGSGELQTIPIMNNSHLIYFDSNLKKGTDTWMHIVSDRPLDLLVLDRDNFTGYYAAEQGGSERWSAYSAVTNVTVGGLNFTVPADGYYIFIIDNTPLNTGGAPGDT
jgi:uncharacterized protein YqgC (DUF456 family)